MPKPEIPARLTAAVLYAGGRSKWPVHGGCEPTHD
jgi:hypothetical protein